MELGQMIVCGIMTVIGVVVGYVAGRLAMLETIVARRTDDRIF